MKNIFSKTTLIIAGILLLGLTVLSAKSIANESGFQAPHFKQGMSREHHGMDPNKMLFMLDRKLDLSKEQRTKIGNVIDQYSPQLRELEFEMKDGRKTARELIKNETFDEKAVQQHAQSQSETLAKIIVLKLRMKHEVRSSLTIDQKQKLSDMFGGSCSRWN